MANIQQLLNDEIRRLARKEVITLEKELKSQLVELRRTVAEQTRRIKALEKTLAATAPAAVAAPPREAETAESSKSVRVTAQRIIQWRTKLGLKRTQYARLLEVSPLSVAHWENGKSTPRESQKKRIAMLRDMGKKELNRLCAEKGIKPRKNPDNQA